MLVCIDCILSDSHKNHEIISTAKARQIEEEALNEQYDVSKDLYNRLSNINHSLENYSIDLNNKANENRQ